MKKQFLEVGKIVGTHGVRGEMRVQPWTDTPGDLARLPVLYLDASGQTKLSVQQMRAHGNLVILRAESVADIPSAERFRNRVVYADRDDIPLPQGQYFIQDLIGCKVYDADTEEFYGTVSDVSATGANDVWHIGRENGQEVLIPSIPEVVVSTDIDGGVIRIRPLEGLME